MPVPAINSTVSMALSATTFTPFALICLNAAVTTFASKPSTTLLFVVSGDTVILPSPLISTLPSSCTKLVVPFVTLIFDSNPLVFAVSTLAIRAFTSAFVNESAANL